MLITIVRLSTRGEHSLWVQSDKRGFFIFGERRLVNTFLKQCTVCQRLRGKPCNPIMADLPKDRLENSPVFTYTGMDLFGPFNVSEGVTTRKNSSTKKVWGLIFVCMTTRAIHIETVGGLDVCSLRNALRRFFSIYGVCVHLRSDNGSNFCCAMRQMESEKVLDDLKAEATRNKCDWIFNPPMASHFGGL